LIRRTSPLLRRIEVLIRPRWPTPFEATIRRQQHDPGTPDVLLRAVPIGDDRGKPRAILRPDVNHDPLAPPADSYDSKPAGIRIWTRVLGGDQ
jgi:hypothetical protein